MRVVLGFVVMLAACASSTDIRIVDANGDRPADLRVWLDIDGTVAWIDCGTDLSSIPDVSCTPTGIHLERDPGRLGVVAKSAGRHTVRVPATSASVPEMVLHDLDAQHLETAYATSLASMDEFRGLAYESPSVLGGTFVVKFYIQDIHGTSTVYFQNTDLYRTHFTFAHDFLGQPVTVDEFNAATYYGADRNAMAGSIILYEDLPGGGATPPSPITVEFGPGDDLTPEMAVNTYLLLEERMAFLPHALTTSALVYVPAGTDQEQQVAMDHGHIFDAAGAYHIGRSDLYAGVTMQLLNPGVAYGTLRVLTPEQLPTAVVSFHDIVVLPRLPNAIPLVGGTITGELQTPLAHVNVIAHTRGSPNLALIGALTDPRVTPFIDHLVRFEVTGDGFTIADTTLAEAQAFWDTRTNRPHYVPPADITRSGLLDFANVGFADSIAIGVKAANVAEMSHIIPDRAPYGFAVPFYYYEQFMTTTVVAPGACAQAEADCTLLDGRTADVCAAARAQCDPSEIAGDTLDAYIARLLADTTVQTDTILREASLGVFRWVMKRASIDPSLATALDSKVGGLFGSDPFRMRSSTNAEDLPNFSGAGLYDSYTAYATGPKAASLRIREVWAGVWNWRAVEERAFWNIDQRATRMGVLVERSFPNEQANGVLITQNISSIYPGFVGMYVNAQLGEVSVTNPLGGALPEVFAILDSPAGGVQVARERYSSLSPDTPLLTDAEIQYLYDTARQVQLHFAPLYGQNPDTYALDIEWKIHGPERALFFKQVRPYVQTPPQ